MPDLLVGATIRPADFPAAVFVQDGTLQNDITTTAPATVGSPTLATTWVAPTSGRVIVVIGIGGRAGANGGRVFGIPETFLGTGPGGTNIIPNTDDEQHGVSTPEDVIDYCYVSRRSLLTGLTPGDTYYTRYVHWADNAGTADITVRDLTIIPTT